MKNGIKPSYNSGVHDLIGDIVAYTIPIDQNISCLDTKSQEYKLKNGFKATYGQYIALGDDYFGVPDEPICLDDPEFVEERFLKAFKTLEPKKKVAEEIIKKKKA